jgi:hypothetical protein
MRNSSRAVLSVMSLAIGLWPLPVAAQPTFEPVGYVLTEGSTFQEGCFAPCACPILEPLPMEGTFVLQRLPSQGPLDLFAVSDIDWLVPALSKEITGTGWYQLGGDLQILSLELQIDGGEVQSFSSGTADNGHLFPQIDITVTMNDYYCYDIVLHIVAVPEPSPGPAPYLDVAATDLAWSPVPGAQGYDVVCGDLGFLRWSGGDLTGAVNLCMADDHPGTSMEYELNVEPGAGLWFLVRDSGPQGTYDSEGASQAGPRDAGIDASPLACP